MAVMIAATLLGAGCSQDPNAKKQAYLARDLRDYHEKKYNEAVVELRNALPIDAKFVPAAIALGQTYAAKSWGPDAVRELERALELKPDSVDAMAALAQVYVALEIWDDTEKSGDMLRMVDPQNPWGPYAVGAALNGQGHSREAADVLGQLVAADIRHPEFFKVYGDALVRSRGAVAARGRPGDAP